MKYLTAFIVFLFFGNISFAQSDPFLQDIVARWQNAKQYTLQVAEAMPETSFAFKPTAEEMTFKEQLIHLSDNMLWLSSSFLSDSKRTMKVNCPKKLILQVKKCQEEELYYL